MNFSLKSLTLLAGLAVMPLLAVPTLRITDVLNAVSVTVTDNVAGQDQPGTVGIAGILTYSGSVGNWTVNVVTGSSKPISGSAAAPNMAITSTNVHTGLGAGELLIEFSDDFFSGSPANLRLDTSASANPFSITSAGKYDSANALFGGSFAASTSVKENTGSPFTGTFSNTRYAANGFTDGEYSLTSMARLKTSGIHVGTFDLRLQAVPEPGFYGALALGLSGLFAVVARRRKANAE